MAGNFRLLTDIRFRLLAFLPFAAGAAASLLTGSSNRDTPAEVRALALSVFGLLVTIALATYNQRNDQLYDELVSRAAAIERELGLPDGAFATRPAAWFRPLLWKVDHRWPVALIYGASVAIWLYSAGAAIAQLCAAGERSAAQATLLIVGGGALAVTIGAGVLVKRLLGARRRAMGEHAKCAVTLVRQIPRHGDTLTALKALARDPAFVEHCARLGCIKPKKVEDLVDVYTDRKRAARDGRYLPAGNPGDVEVAVAFVALLCDLPPQRIDDAYTGRRAW